MGVECCSGYILWKIVVVFVRMGLREVMGYKEGSSEVVEWYG